MTSAGLSSEAKTSRNGAFDSLIVIVTGFEQFNADLYRKAVKLAAGTAPRTEVLVFTDLDIANRSAKVQQALQRADVFFASLLFDFDQVEWLKPQLKDIPVRLVFESALELMSDTKLGGFQMGDRKPPSGLSRTVTNMLRKLNVVGREEDKLAGYLQLLKTGPKLLKFLPGKKVRDVANWLTIYSYWNAGGPQNVSTMVAFISREYLNAARTTGHLEQLPPPVEIPAIGLVHPSRPGHFFNAPRSYLEWYFEQFPERVDRPRVGILLYRKHVVSGQEYIGQMIEHLEYYQLVPVPVFINGVEGHIVVREFFTSKYELEQRERGIKNCPLKERDAVIVNVILSTIGFSLVGGPAGSMSAGRQTNVSRNILKTKNVPFIVGAPLLIQDKESWLSNGIGGLQSVVLYALPELDGSIDTVPLGGLVRDRIVLEPGRLQRLAGRIKAWTKLQRLQPRERKVAIVLYGYPPGQGATGTAALLNVPESLRNVLCRLDQEGYNVGNAVDLDPQDLLLRIKTADEIMEARADSRAVGERMSEVTWVPASSLDGWIGEHNVERIRNQWSGQAVQIKSAGDRLLLGGVLLGNVWIGVQPPLGIAGDPMRLMFERDMTPHPQYAAFYRWIEEDFGASAIVHFGMHGTYEWLPGSPLGNTDSSWSDILLGNLPNLYIYAANNPSESALAKRRGYSTVISHCVPPYGRAGLYSELIIVRDLVDEYLEKSGASEADETLYNDIVQKMETTGLSEEFPLIQDELDRYSYVLKVKSYLKELENRLFSSGLHVYGGVVDCRGFVEALLQDVPEVDESTLGAVSAGKTFREINGAPMSANSQARVEEAIEVRRLLQTSATELDSLAKGLNGEFIEAAPAGDVLRDGASVLPTGRNIYSIDPYRMPSNAAFTVGKTIAEKMILNAGDDIPETVAVPLWGLDNIKTRGESVGIVLGLVGAEPVRDATGRIARFQLIPLKELGRPRIDVLANISGIFRDSFEHVVFLLDDMFKSAAEATDEPLELNFIRKHSLEILAEHGPVEESSARLFSNPVGEFGSMVNERISAGNWDNSQELGDTWKSRNSFAFGRNVKGKKQARTLDTLLATTGQILQQIDSVEYGLTDIQEYYANTGALLQAAQANDRRRERKPVQTSLVESFGGGQSGARRDLKDLKTLLRLEYRSKLLNPKWARSMLKHGSGGAYEVSQRMTALLGWAGTTGYSDDFVFQQSAEQYVQNEEFAAQLRKSNPEAYRNVVGRLLEAHGRGFWQNPDEKILAQLRREYDSLDDEIEGVV